MRRTTTGIPASVTFGVNDTKADFFMRVIPDEERERGEGVRIDFGNLPSNVSRDSWAPYETIEFVDDLLDSTVWFGTDAYTATEGGAAARVSVHLDAPVKLEPLDVGLVLRYGGGATAADHGTIPTSVRFTIGERTKTITVAATNDSDDDDGESVTLSFVNVGGDRVNISHQPVMANTTTVSLADDDGPRPVTVSFGAATYTAREGDSAGVSVSVELDATPGRSVTVPLTTTHRGGAIGGDNSGVPSSVTFGANETRKTFTVMATNDTVDDDGESLSIGFGTLPAGVSAGSPAVVALDDDDGGSVRWVRVGFDTALHIAFQVRESAWPSRITLSLNRVAQRTVTIPLVVTHMGGATAADYTGIPASVTFGPDQRRVGFRVYGTLDEEIESGEGPADRLRHAAAGRESGPQGVIRNRRVRGYVHGSVADAGVTTCCSNITSSGSGAQAGRPPSEPATSVRQRAVRERRYLAGLGYRLPSVGDSAARRAILWERLPVTPGQAATLRSRSLGRVRILQSYGEYRFSLLHRQPEAFGRP